MTTRNWIKIGDLEYKRYAHNVIYNGEVFLVYGGYDSKALKSEKCVLSGTELLHTDAIVS